MSENEKDNTHEKDEKGSQDQQPVQHIQVAPSCLCCWLSGPPKC